jgi:hypothetical protein
MDLQEVGWEARTGFIWLRKGSDGGHLCINNTLGSIKCGEFLE